jgi:hypothetical protein
VFLHTDRQVLVFGQRVRLKSAQRHKGRASPGADGSRYHRQRSERREGATLEVLCDDIFQRLPAGHHVGAIADFGVTGNGADFFVAEPANQSGNRVGLELGVRIERHDDFAA